MRCPLPNVCQGRPKPPTPAWLASAHRLATRRRKEVYGTSPNTRQAYANCRSEKIRTPQQPNSYLRARPLPMQRGAPFGRKEQVAHVGQPKCRTLSGPVLELVRLGLSRVLEMTDMAPAIVPCFLPIALYETMPCTQSGCQPQPPPTSPHPRCHHRDRHLV